MGTMAVISCLDDLSNFYRLLVIYQHLVRAQVWTGLYFIVDTNKMYKVPADCMCRQFNYGRVLTPNYTLFNVFLRLSKLVNNCLISLPFTGARFRHGLVAVQR